MDACVNSCMHFSVSNSFEDFSNVIESLQSLFAAASGAKSPAIHHSTRHSTHIGVPTHVNKFAGSVDDKTILGTWPEGKGGITVTEGDMNRLQEAEFLNDIIINVYLRYLEKELDDVARAKVKIFNSFFFSQFRKFGFERVRRWTKNDNLFNKEFVVVPINESAHWYTAIICFPGDIYGPAGLPRDDDEDFALESPTEDASLEDLEAMYAQQATSPRPAAKLAKPDLVPRSKTNSMQASSMAAASLAGSKLSEVVGRPALPQPMVADDDVSPSPTADHDGDDCRLFEKWSPELLQRRVGPGADVAYPDKCLQSRRRPCILMLDSLGGIHRDNARDLRKYLCQLWRESGHPTEHDFTEESMPLIRVDVPEQDNSTDCGIYLLSFIQSFLSGGHAPKDELHPPLPMGFPYYTNGSKLHHKSYFDKNGKLPLSREGVRKVLRKKLKELPPQATLVEDTTITTHRTNEEGEDVIELD